MKVKVYFPETDKYGRIISPIIKPHGYIELNHFDPEQCFHLCNWGFWTESKPKNLHTDIEGCGHGLILYNPETKKYHLALSVGWLEGKSYEISEYIYRHYKEDIWEEDK